MSCIEDITISLSQFLESNRLEILALSEKKSLELAALRPSSGELKKGIPIFFERLVSVLSKNINAIDLDDEKQILYEAGFHGVELLRLGYTLSHVVHSYGAMCQAITEHASVTKAQVSAQEFHHLNRCLDIAIAGAVTEFASHRSQESKGRDLQHFGSLAHELRNALSRATIAFEMIMSGQVGTEGSTARVLKYSLVDMRRLIDRSMAEIRLRTASPLVIERVLIAELISQLVITAHIEAKQKNQTLVILCEADLEVESDSHLMFAALGNLVQNALKYSKPKGEIRITSRSQGDQALITVEDACSGIAPDKMVAMFEPFVRQSSDKTGLGMGLTIARDAIQKCGGTITVQNKNSGCEFTISLRKASPITTGGAPTFQ
jgi:signal transduction histidine kinase